MHQMIRGGHHIRKVALLNDYGIVINKKNESKQISVNKRLVFLS